MAKANSKSTARSVAAKILADVINEHRSLNTAFSQLKQLAENDRGLCQQLCYGVLRWYPTLTALAEQLLSKPLKNKDADITALLLCGLLQLRTLRTPSHAAISETVNATNLLGKPWAKGLLNACLRQYQRRQDELEQTISSVSSAQYAHPPWLLDRLQQDWPDNWQTIAEANNQQGPMMLRINRQQGSPETYLQKLQQAEIKALPIEGCADGVILNKACDVYELPGFESGEVSVQDGAAQRVVELLALKPGLRILDACAAPGGKTCHILEHEPATEVTALDIDADRLQQIEQNLSRLQLTAKLVAADAADTQSWWDGQQFDRILIDAPCSGTGVIRRHPDIKLLRQPTDIASLAQKQQLLLDELWPLLKPDGLMVYTTCSITQQENEQQIEAFLQRHPDAEELRPDSAPAQPRPYGYQRLPGDDMMDGFYYACLQHR